MKRTYWQIILFLTAALLGAGCTSFEHEWAQAKRTPASPGDLTGAWRGTWQNTNNAHGDVLRAVVTQVNNTNYTARFHAVWGSHRGSFRTKLVGQRTGAEFVFSGRKHILGFLITTRGQANATNFFSTYESRFDTGTFTLQRPAAGE